jgi:UDP-N-acetylmuramate--alanine ligase
MFQLDFNTPVHVHFIGIGGISMSGLAKLLVSRGFTVSGSDSQPSDLTRELAGEGCQILYGQKAENITKDIDVVVYTAAIHPDNPEYAAAVNAGIEMMSRAELLGQVMSNYKTAVNIAGTHGKTTTSSMISQILMTAHADPTISLGGMLDCIGGNFRVGHSDLFVTEACEYTNSFLSFRPTINVILNVQEDHLDFFKDLADIRHSFKLFCEKLPEDGKLIINSDIEDIEYFYQDAVCKNVITFGTNPDCSDYSAADITFNESGCCSYTLLYKGTARFGVNLSIPGKHNVYNSLAAFAAAELIGISTDDILAGLRSFGGVHRRFEKKGILLPNNTTIVDDYAHHPAEIEATLKAASNYPHNNLWVVFQPHTYTRTKAFLTDFAKALSLADKVILADIYAARETDDLGISSRTLLSELEKLGCECYYFPSFSEIEEFIRKNCINNDLLITMGAGNVVEIAENLTSEK